MSYKGDTFSPLECYGGLEWRNKIVKGIYPITLFNCCKTPPFCIVTIGPIVTNLLDEIGVQALPLFINSTFSQPSWALSSCHLCSWLEHILQSSIHLIGTCSIIMHTFGSLVYFLKEKKMSLQRTTSSLFHHTNLFIVPTMQTYIM